MPRTGRRPGAPATRQTILDAARKGFATRGYDATSLRSIATDAKVDPALLVHYFGTKEALFVAATGFPALFSELAAGMRAGEVEDPPQEIVRTYLRAVDSDRSRNAILAQVRSAVSNEKAAKMLREFLTAQLLSAVAELSGEPDAPLRASLVAAQLVGIAMLRHVVRVRPLATASQDELVALVVPVVRSYLYPSCGPSHLEAAGR